MTSSMEKRSKWTIHKRIILWTENNVKVNIKGENMHFPSASRDQQNKIDTPFRPGEFPINTGIRGHGFFHGGGGG